MRPQPEIHAKDKAVGSGFTKQARQSAAKPCEVGLKIKGPAWPVGMIFGAAIGLPFVCKQVDEVDVRGGIKLVPAKLSHTHNQKVNGFARCPTGNTVTTNHGLAAMLVAQVEADLGKV
jgi:hypothetical protein